MPLKAQLKYKSAFPGMKLTKGSILTVSNKTQASSWTVGSSVEVISKVGKPEALFIAYIN